VSGRWRDSKRNLRVAWNFWLRFPAPNRPSCRTIEDNRLQPTQDDLLKLLDENGSRIYAVLFRLTLRYDVADDLMQELFLRISRTGIERARDPAAYAVRTAANLALDWRRTETRRRENVDMDEALNSIHAECDAPIRQLINREETERVLDAVSELPPHAREILVMHYLEQQSFETIGQQLARTPHHVRAMCHKAMKCLRQRLGVKTTVINQLGEISNDP
jgi:RNA polymerase sigma-70 factor (ECF subfamily)